MRGWKQGDGFLAGQESRECFDLISYIGICGIYLYLALGTARSNNLINHVLYNFSLNLESFPILKCQSSKYWG